MRNELLGEFFNASDSTNEVEDDEKIIHDHAN